MIKSIRLKNFFSFEEQTVRLNPDVNLLVGINGSGKSNFIKAFELLRFGINEGPIHKLVNEKWGGFSKTINFSARKNMIELELLVDASQFLKNGTGGKDTVYTINCGNDWRVILLKQQIDLLDENGALNIKEVEKNDEKFHIAAEHNLDESDHNAYKECREHVNLLAEEAIVENRNLGRFKNFIRQIEIYDSINIGRDGAQKRNDSNYKENYQKLSSTFDNLAGLLNAMSIKPETEGAFDKISKSINDININLEGVYFGLDDDQNFYIQIRNLPQDVMMDLSNISNGTIKFLVLMSILYNPNRGNIICLEEPEDGLHPDMINMVAKGIKHAAKTSQMIVSTHSPFLLNAFELEDILVFENDEKGNTIVKELSQDNFDDWTDDFMVGQLWVNGHIGGKRW